MKTNCSLIWKLAGLLAVATFLAFWPVHGNQFVNVDDPQYLLQNASVNSGLSWRGIAWAFRNAHACNWHPVTWMSHMLDCSLFGLNPTGHHLVSLAFHSLNASLLFLFLCRLTRATWRSLLVAAFFALHPLRVESVAWISERKDVLSGFFALLALISYCVYRELSAGQAKPPQVDRSLPWRLRCWYGLTLLSLSLGLMSKPMLVTLPFVFCLLDFWRPDSHDEVPAGIERFNKLNLRSLREKIPFFALSVIAALITFFAQKQGGAVSSTQTVPLGLRLANAALAYMQYLGKTLVPIGLSPIYPLPTEISWLPVVASVLALIGITTACALLVRRNPAVAIGWLWFVGMLIPTIGIIQVGPQAMADRYTYLPGIGLLIGLVWGLHALLQKFEIKQSLITFGASGALALCFASTWSQTLYWRDGITLYGRAFTLCPSNYVACDYLGNAFHAAGRENDALLLLRESVRLQPSYPEAQFNLGTLLLENGELAESIKHLETAVQLSPLDANAWQSLGIAFLKSSRFPEAEDALARAARLSPGAMGARMNLGAVLAAQSKWRQAQVEFAAALKLSPGNAEAERNLALAFVNQGAMTEAIMHFRGALEMRGRDPAAHFDLGLAYLEANQPRDALVQFRESLQLKDGPWTRYRLGQSLDRLHDLKEAVDQYREALRQAPDFLQARQALDVILPLLTSSPAANGTL